MQHAWFKFYPGDWLSDRRNAALTLEELGAHIQLLCLMWDSDDCSVPDDDQWVARQLRVTVAKWRKLRAVLVDSPMAVLRREEIQGKSVLFSPKLREIFAENLARVEQTRQAARQRWAQVSEALEPASSLDSGPADASDSAMRSDCARSADAYADASKTQMRSRSRDPEPEPEPDSLENPPPLSSPNGEDPLPPSDTTAVAAVVAQWNAVAAPPLPRVSVLTPQRRAKVEARCRGHPERTPDWWAAYFGRIAAAPFCAGANPRGWRATFDWAVRSEEVVARVLEGVYDTPRPNGYARDRPATRFAANLAAIRQGMEEEDSHDP